MILDYKQYINKINSLKTELRTLKNDVGESIILDLENEFSKYLKKTTTTDFDYNGSNIFLLDDNYGIRIILDSGNLNARINVVYKSKNTKNKFMDSYDIKIFKTGEDSIKNFVKKNVETLNKKYITRQKSMQNRELNKVSKKYNI